MLHGVWNVGGIFGTNYATEIETDLDFGTPEDPWRTYDVFVSSNSIKLQLKKNYSPLSFQFII
jgi:hypothetical protein